MADARGVEKLFFEESNNRTFAGRSIKTDITRLLRVFGEIDCLSNLKIMDINVLRKSRKYRKATREDGLSDWLHRVTGLKLADKGNRSVRSKGRSLVLPS